ncbi:hypothetical protein [Streptomyces viridochromogenes]|uniref:hypothetical protein n=1 Tax=Streptomyces viridochromogenes TaxID=1938 RepID=UPI00069EC0D3|nr:hypothetical protein [Streptomyces viridochromogenes]
MSWANNGPAGPPQGQPYGPPQTPPPQGPHQPHQPRWAWWVIGIVIPVVGILITILVSRPGASDDKSAEETTTPAQSSASTGSTDRADQEQQPTPTKSASAAKPLYGPVEVADDITDAGFYLELDTSKPVVVSSKGADVIFSASIGDPGLTVPGSASNLAPWPDPEAVPTAAECLQSVERNGSYSAYVKAGDGFCLRTSEGRVAYLDVISAPDRGTGKLKVTVWETPDV